jgi:hypothetical protein
MNGKVISGPAAVLIVVLFFLPWVTVSCDGTPMGDFSGYHLATGTAPEDGQDVFAGSQIEGDPILFAIPLIGLVTLILLGITIWKSSFETNAGWGQIIASFIGLLILGLEWLQLRGQEGVFEITLQPALWGTMATLVAIGGGAVFDLVRGGQRKSSFPYTKPQMPEQRPSQPVFTPSPFQEMSPSGADSNYTILDDALTHGSAYANETILDDDAFETGGMGSETIVDDDFKSGGSDYTVFGDDIHIDDKQSPLSTARPPEEPKQEAAKKGFELVWKVDDKRSPARPSSPPDDANIQKTEVLQFNSDTSAWLVIGSGERRGEQFRLLADTLVGRDTTNDIVIDDTAMSNVHARIRSENDRFFVFDQNSTNGVLIFDTANNRWEKRDAYELKNGDQIKIGRTVLHFMTA